MLRCSIWFSAPSFWMGGCLESRCVGRVYGADGAVRLTVARHHSHLDTGFSWFPCAQKQMLRWFPRFQVTTTCFSCSPPDLNLVVTNFMFCLHVK